MSAARVSAVRLIPARAQSVYALLADYREGHPRILPPAFTDFRVLAGGIGEGTRIRFDLRVGGRVRRMEGQVTEPEPGRVLAETYGDGSVTSFTIDPVHNEASLRIETTWEPRSGFAGLVERLVAPRLLIHLYRAELGLIEKWARNLGSPYR
jgi:hypothetical protein